MRLFAISDLHLASRENREGLKGLGPHPNDWLIVAGDIGETEAHLRYGLAWLTRQFRQVVWTPGNHDLWTLPNDPTGLRGEAKYRRLVDICREYGALTPEDPYVDWPPAAPACRLAPLFLHYDYSFRPDDVPLADAIRWAAQSGIVAQDESLLFAEPYPSPVTWCRLRCRYTEKRLAAATSHLPFILINHYPLRQDLVRLRWFPRFSIWCGTRHSEDWHTRFPVAAVVYGHLHIRGTHDRDGVRFEEVSLGYPKQWDQARGIEAYLRLIATA